MKKAADAKPTTDTPPEGTSLSSLRQLRVGQALLATTWRTVTPVVFFAGLGIFADLHIGTKPWLTLLGVVVGFILAGFLITRLLKESETL